MNCAQVRLRRGREKQIERGHPWVFSGAIEDMGGDVSVGAAADIFTQDGRWIARGLLHPNAALAVRIYTQDEADVLDDAFFARRVESAVRMRSDLLPLREEETNARRLVYSESDGLSGLIVDRYADTLAVHIESAALVPHLDAILAALRDTTRLARVVVRADDDAMERESIRAEDVAARSTPGAGPVRFRENGFEFTADLAAGQKTGFFLDQRINRLRAAAYARSRRVLSAYCYTGAFEVCAAHAGASAVTGIDRSEAAIERAREHHSLNGTTCPTEYRKEDAPEALRRFRDRAQNFDMIILDPPRFVSSAAQKEKGLRAYKDVNLLAAKLLTPGGILVTFSCSGLVNAADFRTMLAWAAADSGKHVRILESLGQPPDHPILTSFPESDYLKGLICAVE